MTMKPWQRTLFYLSLNALVSACVTLAVLFVWDQWIGPLPRGLLPLAYNQAANKQPTPAATQGAPTPRPTPTEAFLVYQVQSGDTFESIAQEHNVSVDELIAENGFKQSQVLGEGEVLRIPVHPRGVVVIDSVIGVGDLNTERVLLKHKSGGEITLTGWRLEDDAGNVFIFPEAPVLTLYAGGAVNLYTKAGPNTIVDLFWGLDHPIWKSGASVVLKDADGNVQARYMIP
jgi:LysM repeat protein